MILFGGVFALTYTMLMYFNSVLGAIPAILITVVIWVIVISIVFAILEKCGVL